MEARSSQKQHLVYSICAFHAYTRDVAYCTLLALTATFCIVWPLDSTSYYCAGVEEKAHAQCCELA